jgi:hypothetical protein
MSNKKVASYQKGTSSQSTDPTASLSWLSLNDDEDSSASASSDIVSLSDDEQYSTVQRRFDNGMRDTIETSMSSCKAPFVLQDYSPPSFKTKMVSKTPRQVQKSRRWLHPPPRLHDNLVPLSVMTEEVSTTPSQVNTSYDRLTVFQAAPLVFKNKEDKLIPLKTMDFTNERETLTKAIADATSRNGTKIEVDFQIASKDRLGDFLVNEEGQTLHFSCHGHRK